MSDETDGRALTPFSDYASTPDNTPGGVRLHRGVDELCGALIEMIALDGAAVAILTGSRRVRELVYATDAIAEQLDELQFTLGEGPCLDAFALNGPQLWAHLDSTLSVDALWPGFAVAAVDAGARAVFAFPIPAVAGPLGVLELYRLTAGNLESTDIARATECASAIGRTLLRNWHIHRSRDNPSSSDGVNSPFSPSAMHVAAGMTAVQLGISPDEGLDRLRAYAYAQQTPIGEVAANIIARRLSLSEQDGDPSGPER